MFVTEEACLARPDFSRTHVVSLPTSAQNLGKAKACRQALMSMGKWAVNASRRYILGDNYADEANARAQEIARQCENRAREALMKEKISQGYLGLGVWQHDLDYPEVHDGEENEEDEEEDNDETPGFQSLDAVVMAGIEQAKVKDKVLMAKPNDESTRRRIVLPKPKPTSVKDAEVSWKHKSGLGQPLCATSRPRGRYTRLFRVVSLIASMLKQMPSNSLISPVLNYGPGEVFDVLQERGQLWFAIKKGESPIQTGWIWKADFAVVLDPGLDPVSQHQRSKKKPVTVYPESASRKV